VNHDVLPRVAEVLRVGPGRGTGYAVAPDLVLTAAHVVEDDVDVRVVVGEAVDNALPGTVVWRDEKLDAALVRVSARPWEGVVTPTLWGKLSGVGAVPCVATGFPKVQKDGGGARVEETVAGFIMPATGRRIGRYAINVTSALPYEPDVDDSPWAGMSGAAVLSADGRHVLGVLVEDPTGFEAARLEAVPVEYLLNDPAFTALVGTGADALHTLPAHPFLRPVYELPPQSMTDIQLLLPKFGVVPYVERPAVDPVLLAWATGGDSFAVAVVVGAGGTGKTRLAAEVCTRLRQDGWDAGRVDDPVGVAVGQFGSRTMLVVDYAEHQDPESVRQLIVAIAERPVSGKVRLLLLARHDRYWWEWIRPAVLGGTTRGDALRLDLEDFPFDFGARSAYASAAAGAFAERLGLASLPAVDVSSDEYDTALLVQIAALLAVRGEAVGEVVPGDLRRRLLSALLGRELLRWYRSFPAEATPLPLLRAGRLPERAVLITLLAAPERAQLPRLLRLLDEFSDARNERLAAVGAWLAGLFANGAGMLASDRLERIGPDPLVDWFVACSPDLLPIAQAVLVGEGQGTEHAAQLFNTVRLSAEHHAAARATLVELLRTNLARLVRPAVDAGDHQLIGALNAAVVLCSAYGDELGTFAKAAGEALQGVDPTDPSLGALGPTLSECVVRGYRRLAARPDVADLKFFRAAFAQALVTLVASRASDGDAELALPEATEAVGILRQLVDEDASFRPLLAIGLANLGPCLSGIRRHDDAVIVTEEAVAILRERAKTGSAARGELGSALNNLGGCYAALERYEEALTALSEAIETFDGLIAEGDDSRLPQLMNALGNLAQFYWKVDDRPAAAAAATRAVHVARSLVAKNHHRHAVDLVRMLTLLSRMALPGAALAATREAVRRVDDLAKHDDHRHRSVQIDALTSLADAQAVAGLDDDALVSYSKALAVLRRLAENDRKGYRHDLASSLVITAGLLRTRGDLRGARDAAAEAAAVLDTGADGDPEPTGWLSVTAHTIAGDVLLDLGDPRAAARHLELAITTSRQLGTDTPTRRADLANNLHRLGNCRSRLGHPLAALPRIREAIDLYTVLIDAGETHHQRSLAATYHSLGACWLRLERPGRAIESTTEAIRLHREADRHDEPNPAALADCLSNLGMGHLLNGDPERAADSVREALAVYRKLASTDPRRYRRLFAGVLSNLSSCLRLADQPAEALTFATEAVKVARRLPQPRDRWSEHTLATALLNLGATRAVQGLVKPALDVTVEAAGMLAPLAAQDPDAYLADLMKVVGLRSELHLRDGQPQQALDAVLETAALTDRIQGRGLQVAFQSAEVYELVGDRYADVGTPDRSVQWWQRAVQIHVTGARTVATEATARNLAGLADKLSGAGRSGAADVARRLADDVLAEAAADTARVREAIAKLDAM
jgi:tetratricopeptide (TPR) repeat protein